VKNCVFCPLTFDSRDGNIDAVRLLLQAYPKGTSTPDWECKTPLHRAIRDMHEDVASLLIDQDPNALKSESMSGNLPIDITMRMPSSFELFSKMARTWPGGCKNVLEKIGTDEDIHNWQWSKIELSLRYAADLIHPSSVSSASASLSGKKKKNKKKKKKNKKILPQYFPLHTALYLTQNNSLLQRVIDSNLDLVNKRDKMGELPLHIALERYNNTAKEHIQRLIDLYPDGAAQRDSLGRLPLHIALVKRCDLSIIDALLLANPKSVIDCFSRGEGEIMKKPIFLALEAGCNVDILYTLLKFDPSVFNCIQ
jgi:ankyrin repeat protein